MLALDGLGKPSDDIRWGGGESSPHVVDNDGCSGRKIRATEAEAADSWAKLVGSQSVPR